MSANIALLGTFVLIFIILRVESNQARHVSIAIWLPTVWYGIMSSRAVGAWFLSSSNSYAEGSAHDRIVLNSLTLLSLFVLHQRRFSFEIVFKSNAWLFTLLIYILLGVVWSDFPMSTFKAWVKSIELVIIASVVLIEKKPLCAFESIIRRCSYINIPLSLCLIKWLPKYGVGYSYFGERMPSGVTRHKNSLGLICAIFSFFLIWSLYVKWRNGKLFEQKNIVFTDLFVIGIAIYLLFGGEGAYSATSISIWCVMLVLMVFLLKYNNITEIIAMHIKKFIIFGVIFFIISINFIIPIVTNLMGREQNLTGRDKIWESVLMVADKHPWLGTALGGYWGLKEWEFDFNYVVDQAHNGYLDVLMQLGRIGLVLFSFFILMFSKRIGNLYSYNKSWGVLGICFLVALLIYNYSEGAFLRSNSIWGFAVFYCIALSKPVSE